VKPWFPEVPAWVRDRGHLHLFADFDGTLSPIAPTPEQAVLPERARAALEKLVARPRTTVTVVSGRAVETLVRKVAVEGVVFVGNHGMEVLRDGERTEHPVATAARPAIARLQPRLAELVDQYGGALEDKQISLSLHTRLITDDAVRRRVEHTAWEMAADEHGLQPFGGKRIVEVRPRNAPNKGSAMLELLVAAHGNSWTTDCAAVFLGDDLTDEDGFRALGDAAATVLVREGTALDRPTAARYFADGVDGAIALLESLL
jgi:trehalose-phosphatase